MDGSRGVARRTLTSDASGVWQSYGVRPAVPEQRVAPRAGEPGTLRAKIIARAGRWRCDADHILPSIMHVGQARPRAAPLMLFILAALGCGAPSADETQATARSWTATLRLASAERRDGAITARYARQLRERAASALGELRAAPGQSPASRAATDSLAAVLATLDVERSER